MARVMAQVMAMAMAHEMLEGECEGAECDVRTVGSLLPKWGDHGLG